MIWQQIVKKLTSRKFWTAAISFVTAVVVFSGADAGTAERVVSLIWAGATMIAYIVGEGIVDAAAAGVSSVKDSDGGDA